MRFKIQAAEIIQALDVVSNVTPRPITPQGGVGYLFKVYRDSKGNPRCHAYSRDQNEVIRADMKLLELDGEGVFIAPLKFLDGIRFLPDDEIDIEIKSEGEAHTIKYTSTSLASMESPTFDPRLIKTIDKDFEAAGQKKTFPAGILREAIGMSKKFLADAKDSRGAEDHLKTLQVFDDTNEAWVKGNGTMFATNGTKMFYFFSEAFEKNGLAIHGDHLARLGSFLSKCDGNVDILNGESMMFAVSKTLDKNGDVEREHVFGWAYHTKTHSKYSYYSLKLDKYVLRLPKVTLINALNFTRTGLEPNRDKVKISFSAKAKEVSFNVVDNSKKGQSFPIPVETVLTEDGDFSHFINIEQLLELVSDVKGHEVLFRVYPIEVTPARPKGGAMFRTIDEFWVDATGKVIGGSSTEKDSDGNEKRPDGGIKCRVTRFMPSKD